ncbi:uncharacterized protein LOC106135747 [Amyelois transitella]|uniref:uncharacterized protein LOC106135747 n=1 Tax=Amyelois transitella TaxID=680683 RepID=UPI00067D1D39|nr:uncharacterized protein LOC106135747 [Amyelois transitella]
MISHKTPRKVRLPRMPKNIERLYKEGKCRDCTVVVTRMDFAKILGKFTKVKIQYESNSTPKTKKVEAISPNSNARLKRNENGMVLLHRNAYKPHPVKELIISKKDKASIPKPACNVLKENNRLKKSPIVKDKNSNLNIPNFTGKSLKSATNLKQYGIIFVNPSQARSKNDMKSKTSLDELLPLINKSILPSEDWYIEYLPLKDEPTDDKVYDRIAAELEDLMYNEKPDVKPANSVQSSETGSKPDEFPSIMDILNDDSSESKKENNQSNSVEFKSNLESSDVEAMLLGKPGIPDDVKESVTAMEVDTSDVTNLIEDVAQLNAIQGSISNQVPGTVSEEFENPNSPSILDEALKKGIEEHLPLPNSLVESDPVKIDTNQTAATESQTSSKIEEEPIKNSNLKDTNNTIITNGDKTAKQKDITHVTFTKKINGTCQKSVTLPKNMKYSIEIEGKQVELIGAPKFISSLDDLNVLLQIVDDTELKSLYILY